MTQDRKDTFVFYQTLFVNYIYVCILRIYFCCIRYLLQVAYYYIVHVWVSTDDRIILCNIIITRTIKLLSDIAL
jgi:hypothetical protein